MHAKSPTLLALLAVSPFLLAFSPPQDGGTHVSVSGGGGRFVATSGCARPRMVEHADMQAGAYHRWVPKRSGWTPASGVGLDVNSFASREKECAEEGCANTDPGWEENDLRLAFSPYVTLDWEWAGASLKGHLPLHGLDMPGLKVDFDENWLPLPFGGSVRAGRRSLYASMELLDAQPIPFGPGIWYGVGGSVLGSELWAGLSEFEPGASVGARFGRRFGPVGLRLSGEYSRSSVDYSATDSDGGGVVEEFSVEIPQYTVSAGLDWRLPW